MIQNLTKENILLLKEFHSNYLEYEKRRTGPVYGIRNSYGRVRLYTNKMQYEIDYFPFDLRFEVRVYDSDLTEPKLGKELSFVQDVCNSFTKYLKF